jgi:magnesium and cobalt transporter
MLETNEKSSKPTPPTRGLLERISAWLMREPEDREQLLEILHHAHDRNLVDADALSMIEGVLQVSDLKAKEIMVPRARMDVIDINNPPEQYLDFVIETAHSRFPVIDGNKDQVIGILLAKDLLRYIAKPQDTTIRDMLRPAVFIPESKPLNILLRDFRINRNHIAIVVDEYGGVAGLITIEDILEQIVGDIEDEFDINQSNNLIMLDHDGHYRVHALTTVEQFNQTFDAQLDSTTADTIGGVVTDHLARVPRRGEVLFIGNLRFEILRADARQVHLFKVEKLAQAPNNDDSATN